MGEVIATVGAVLSTVNVVLADGAALVFKAASLATAAATEIPTVPSPVQLVSVTVGEEVVPLVTALEQVAMPVVLRVILAAVTLMVLAPVTVKA